MAMYCIRRCHVLFHYSLTLCKFQTVTPNHILHVVVISCVYPSNKKKYELMNFLSFKQLTVVSGMVNIAALRP